VAVSQNLARRVGVEPALLGFGYLAAAVARRVVKVVPRPWSSCPRVLPVLDLGGPVHGDEGSTRRHSSRQLEICGLLRF
jgi:hypothetical protein